MNNLRNLRKEKGLSIPELHRHTGIPIRTLEMWDTEKRMPTSYHRIKAISKILGCSPDDFMTKVEKCLYDGKNMDVVLVDVEKGVYVRIFEENDEIASITVSQDKAMELLNFVKMGWDVKVFF